MDFEDEPYMRLYQRDTKTWLRWRWEGQTVFVLTSRKLDRAGVLDDVTDPVTDVALITGLPEEVVSVGLERVLKSGTFEIRGGRLVAPRYVEAQTAVKSNRLRSAELRKRRRDRARTGDGNDEVVPPDVGVTRDSKSEPSVTDETRSVTPEPAPVSEPTRRTTRHNAATRGATPSLAYPSLAYPNQTPRPPDEPPKISGSTSSPSGRKRTKAPRARTLCPTDLQPDETTAAEAWKLGFTDELLARTVTEFINWWRGDGRLKADWQATLRNRLLTEAERRALKPRKPRDAQWLAERERYQEQRRLALGDPPKKPVPLGADFEKQIAGIIA
jgi:hypothetical protein